MGAWAQWRTGPMEGRRGKKYLMLTVLISQVRDEFRTEYDPGRGGFGHMVKLQLPYPSSHFVSPNLKLAQQRRAGRKRSRDEDDDEERRGEKGEEKGHWKRRRTEDEVQFSTGVGKMISFIIFSPRQP